ncbi:helix-turn-helix domain-containing protein [Methanoregula sp. UBA64]|jgi:excisionase family DNA binding protein|uniref:helix-turn-helix domain-containing protein n=1 Tax=Methanoregula sp. UBA64 TaxID=1915554 RepID=UPI0025F3BE44|nr:helix-turn-helix domain-containing protein [Methanoregula sp. UBA64]
MVTDPQFLTPKEVAGILGVHPKTVHQWLRTGKLPGTKISYRAWRISRSAFEQFIAQSSNRSSTYGKPAAREEQGTFPQDPAHPQDKTLPDPGNLDPTIKMKHYIRDIMGEDSPDHNKI